MDKQIITFSANEQILRKTGGLDIYASKTVSYIEAHFDLGENWGGFNSVEAVWWNDFVRPVRTVLDTEGVCIVPPEVLLRKSVVYVNLVGVIASGNTLTDRLTSVPITALTVKFNAQLGEGTTTPLTPSEYQQFVASVKADADRAETAKDDARGYAEDAEASAQNALASETNASTSETNAHTSEVNAEAYKNQAQASASSASASAENAEQSAENAENAKDEAIDARDEIRNMSATATTLPAGSDATASYSGGVLSLGIPKGDKGDRGEQGIRGETGATPNFTIGTVETLEPTEDATATITGTAENPILNLGIPQGEVGEVSYADLKTLLPMDTASGSIVSITDGQSVIPVESLKVALEPIQDLHGYDKPWSGGAGKNILDPSAKTVYSGSEGARWYYGVGITLKANTTYVFKYFPTNAENVTLYIKKMDTSNLSTAINSVSYTPTEDITAYLQAYRGGSLDSSDNKFGLYIGSAENTWTPYENICPISGRTEVDTVRTGKNLWNKAVANGYVKIDNIKAGATYTATAKRIDASTSTYCYIQRAVSDTTNYENVGYIIANRTENVITFTAEDGYDYYVWCNSSYTNVKEAQLELGSTATDYEPYQGDTYHTDLGRTVYGGTLDVVSGVLTVDRVGIELDETLPWTKSVSYPGGYYFSAYQISPAAKATTPFMCSHARTVENLSEYDFGTCYCDGSLNIRIMDASSTLQDWKDYIVAQREANTPIYICYYLETPLTYQLTPQEVRLLLGNNNVWSDGDVTMVYSADVTKWIEKQLS